MTISINVYYILIIDKITTLFRFAKILSQEKILREAQSPHANKLA